MNREARPGAGWWLAPVGVPIAAAAPISPSTIVITRAIAKNSGCASVANSSQNALASRTAIVSGSMTCTHE